MTRENRVHGVIADAITATGRRVSAEDALKKAQAIVVALEADGWTLTNEAADFAEAFVNLPLEEQERIREDFNRPRPLIGLMLKRAR